ncbi:HAMP domain-containing histidine kinase [Sulfitobacter albidus]|uniref:histidine kinase n=1 Tax=Sulfitobacter albidus TaxID=2829501 RepID=A0A975PMR5_9RHOB|nr:HAMP domain-containing sensor histidine kinase [Sulfitobacter albidus]QUJ76520.1 HAMP domain-containing histidine kinase [Sulfitobacter albidus]
MRGVARKWRPPLALVVGGTLAAVFVLPLLGIGYFRLAGNILGWWETVLLIAAMAGVATLLLGFLMWRLVLRPVYALTRHARALRRGHTGTMPTQFGTPEFGELGQSVFDMGETLHARADSLRAYADHVTHELKSPLTAITGAAELLDGDLSDADRAALAATIAEAAQRMERLLDALHRHAGASHSAEAGSCQLAEVAQDLDGPGLTVTVARDGVVPLAAQDLEVVLSQLAQNSRAHGATRMTLTLGTDGLVICDNGTGISAGNRDRVFDPFFTTRRTKGGTGMGLSIVRMLLAARGARIALADSTQGTAFVIRF